MHGKAFTFEERKLIENHIKNGCSYRKTARLIGRSANGVRVEVTRSGGTNYSAEIGQSISEGNKEEKRNKLRKNSKCKGENNYLNMKKRIENLEMQVDILHDTLKGLLNK